jgi:hypothetical protein
METRLIIAYAIIAFLVLAGGLWALYSFRNTWRRKYDRRVSKETAEHHARMRDPD